MAELMDTPDPFYEIVLEGDDDAEDDKASEAAPLSTGDTNAEKTDAAAAEKVKEGESEINGENIEDDMEMEESSHRLSILDRGAPMLLCAVASDSSLVYQRLCDAFLTPDPPVDIQGRRQHRKRRLQT
ncbi:hypothetical protein cypCar_00025305 [Cyprinus carpio]|nr:hypothetical protein cypCar_00025305 [Cyprinus carpio]